MIIPIGIVPSNPSSVVFLFFVLLFFAFFFFSLPLLLAMPHTSHLQERSPKSIALLFLQYVSEVWIMMHTACWPHTTYIVCWPLDRRILHELYFACAATSRVPPAFDREWFISLANRSQLHVRFLSGPCLSLLRPTLIKFHWRPAHGDLRAQKKKKKKHRWHCIWFQEATSFPCFAMIGNGRVNRLLGTRRKVKIFRRKRPLHRTVLSLTPRREFAPSVRLDKGQLTNAFGAHLTVESYDRMVKDSSCVHWISEEHNSDR